MIERMFRGWTGKIVVLVLIGRFGRGLKDSAR